MDIALKDMYAEIVICLDAFIHGREYNLDDLKDYQGYLNKLLLLSIIDDSIYQFESDRLGAIIAFFSF